MTVHCVIFFYCLADFLMPRQSFWAACLFLSLPAIPFLILFLFMAIFTGQTEKRVSGRVKAKIVFTLLTGLTLFVSAYEMGAAYRDAVKETKKYFRQIKKSGIANIMDFSTTWEKQELLL